jgi:hypothetical protein
MCGAIGESPGRVIDWDRIERFVVTTRVAGGTQSQSIAKEDVQAVLKDGYSTERYQLPSLEEYPPGDVPQQWSRDYLKQLIRETIREYGLVPNNYAQVERGPVGGVSEKAGDATDGPEDWTGASRPEWSHRNATDGESRPPTPSPERAWSHRNQQGIEWDIDRNLPVYTRDLYELGKHWWLAPRSGRTLRDVIENFAAGYGRTSEGD